MGVTDGRQKDDKLLVAVFGRHFVDPQLDDAGARAVNRFPG